MTLKNILTIRRALEDELEATTSICKDAYDYWQGEAELFDIGGPHIPREVDRDYLSWMAYKKAENMKRELEDALRALDEINYTIVIDKPE